MVKYGGYPLIANVDKCVRMVLGLPFPLGNKQIV